VFILTVLLTITVYSQLPARLIVRADDMGVTHATNLACIDVFTKGIARSVEVMVPTPWFIEAVQFLNEHPEYDAGIHLVLNCEWSTLKWRPLTHAKSLTDSNGYFFPTPWKGSADFPSLHDNKPDFAEAEKELRAQIEMAKKHIPHLSHISTHMGFDDSHPELKKIIQRLSEEYHLPITRKPAVENFPGSEKMSSTVPDEREKAFIDQLTKLEKGKTYLLVTHPCHNTPEMKSISTPTYKNVGSDRAADLFILTSKKVQQALKKKSIELISIKEFMQSLP
jgi:chitin disaccharide deacetylase